MIVSIEQLLRMARERNASDLHLTSGAPPILRIDGELIPTEFEPLSAEDCQKLIYSILTSRQKEKFEHEMELDLSFGSKELGRIRMNVFRQRGAVAAALRTIPNRFFTFEELNLPKVINSIVNLRSGLVLVTGPTGCGKTTTLASIINYLNQHINAHIVTIEDPIEYVHQHKKCIINQREVGSDTESFHQALRRILRQDPDVVLIGEMRDLETINTALTVAETGHLVFATLHTTDAVQTINRVIDVFPPHQQEQVRSQLSFVLQAILCQRLVPRDIKKGLILACEVLIATPAVRNLIREEKIEQIQSHIQSGGKYGMQTLNMSLYELYRKQEISFQQAFNYSLDPEDLKRIAKKS